MVRNGQRNDKKEDKGNIRKYEVVLSWEGLETACRYVRKRGSGRANSIS